MHRTNVTLMKYEKLDQQQKKIMQEYGLDETNTVNASSVFYEYGERMMDVNEPLENILILSRGTVKVCAEAPNGKNLILCYYVQQGILGDMELLKDHPHIANSVIAASPVQAVCLPYQMNKQYLENNLIFMKHLAKDLALKLTESSRRYAASVLDTAEQRLAGYILSSSRNGIFSEVMKDVSMSTGMSYRHMYRILDRFTEEKILQKDTNGYIILDKNRLKQIEDGK